MQIIVKSLQGEEYLVQAQPEQMVSHLKDIVSQKSGGRISPIRQKLVYKGRTMQDTTRLAEYNLDENCKVHLIVQKESDTHKGLEPHPGCESISSRFEILLRERLARYKHFTPEQLERIMSKLHQEIRNDVQSSSLDDLERLAKQKLNISNQ